MAFRHGENGRSDWHKFRKAGIAAIGYPDIEAVDFSKYGERKAKRILKRNVLAPSQKSSLRQFVYTMRKGDTIYVKEGRRIVGKGTIVSDYRFAKAGTGGVAWPHRRRVQWSRDFKPRRLMLGSNQRYTVQRLTGDLIENQPPSNSDNARVLFARVGHMTYYAGPMKGDERPLGGGEYNTDKLGHEAFNFARFNGDSKRVVGFFHATRSAQINLQRIDPQVPKEAYKDRKRFGHFRSPLRGWSENRWVVSKRYSSPHESSIST
jgi:hypothetical protein